MSLHSDTFRSAAAAPKDIMLKGGMYDSLASGSSRNPLNVDTLKQYFNNADSSQRSTLSQAFIGAVDPKQDTLMNKLLPNNNYQVKVTPTSSQHRSGSNLVNDGGKVSSQVAGAKQEAHVQASRLKDGVKGLQKEANTEQKGAAQDLGVDPKAAADTFAPQAQATKGSAAVMAIGAGTFGDVTSVGTITVNLSKADKKLSPDKQQAVLEQELTRLQSPSSSALSLGAPKPKAAAWENASTQDVREVHSLDVNNLSAQLPEMAELENIMSALDDVDNNHKKLEDQGDVNFDAAIDIDSIDVVLAGQGLCGISALTLDVEAANEANFSPSVSDISEKLPDPEKWTYEPTRLQQMSLS